MDVSTFLLIRGLVGVLIGILAVTWPGMTIAVLALSRTRTHGRSWALSLQGVAGIVAGVLTFIWPGVTALVLVLFIGAWAIVTGGFEIAAAVLLRRHLRGEWLLALRGVMSGLVGVF